MKVIAFACLALLASPQAAWGQHDPKTPSGRPPRVSQESNLPLSQLRVSGRVYVGDPAPDFMLTASKGRDVTLSQYRGNWLLLHFASDRKDFAMLRDAHAELAQMGMLLVGICKDKPQGLRSFAQRESIAFELLADATGEISAIYGLYDHERATSRAGFVVVDRNGIVRLALMGQVPPQQVAELARFTMTGF